MPKVMPVAIRDETGAFIRQMAQGNEALAQLYARLLAQYHERRESEAFKREMFDRGVQEKRDYWDYTQGTQDEGDKPHPFGSRGAQPNPVSPPTAAPAATPTTPAARPMPMMPGATPIPGQDSFTSGGGTPPAASPVSSNGGVPVTPGYDSFASAKPLVEEFSSQQRIGAPPPPDARLPRGARRVAPPPGQLPRGTGMDARPRKPRKPPAQAEFLPIGEEWLDKMSAAEKKYGVPQGSLLALYGFENAGGRVLGKNAESSAAGLFQFTERLMQDYKLDPSLRNNPDVMIDLAARNMSRNARVLERDYKVKLEPNSETLPFFTLMHQLGIGDGPRVVAMLLKNPDAPMVKVMANVPGRDNATTLANNRIPSNYTVGQVFSQHSGIVRPWYDNGLKLLGNRAQQPGATSRPQPQPQSQPQTAAVEPPRPPADVPNAGPQRTEPYGPLTAIRKGPEDMRGVNPRLYAAARGGEQYLPEGYTIKLTSGARPTGRRSSQHFTGNASDWQIYTPDGKPIPNSGPDRTGMYTRWARGVKTWVAENDPQLLKQIGSGAAFETSRGSGRQDLMHLDLGGSRGRLAPDLQFANLKPLAATDRRGATPAVATAPQAPQAPQASQVAMRQPKPTEVYKNPELPATSAGWFGGKNEPFRPFDVTGRYGVPTSDPLTTNTDAMQLAAFGDPKQAPPLPRLTPQQGGAALAAGPGGLAARSALDYVAGGEPQVPQASGVPARSEIDYNAPPAPQQREAPTVAPYEAAPEEPPQPQQREAPEVGPYEAPPEYENRDAVPQSPTPFDWPQEGMPQSPDIAGPPINLQGVPPSFPTAQGDYPPPAFPQVAETSHNYDPSSRAGRRIDAMRNQPPAGPSYFDQLIRQATSGANITPTLPLPPSGVQGEATATGTPEDVVVPPTPPTPTAKPTPTTIRDITKAIYGSEIVRPRVGGGRGAAEVEYARNANQPKPPTAEGTSEERQAQFNAAMQEYVKEKLGGAPVEMARGAMERIFKAAPDVMQQIIDKAKEYSGSPASSTRVKSSAYGRDWMPTKPTPQAPGAKPPKPGDDLPPPVGTLPDIPRPGASRQQPTVMPNVTGGKMPPTPGSGGAAPQASTAEARRQAAAAKVNSGDNYSYTDDAGVVQFEIKE